MPITTYQTTDEKTLLSNPFAENKIGGNVFGTKPVGDLGIVVKTKDPIITSNKPFRFNNASQSNWDARKKLNENLLKTKEEVEKSWWQKRTKTQKNLIVGGSILVVAILGYLIYKKVSKN